MTVEAMNKTPSNMNSSHESVFVRLLQPDFGYPIYRAIYSHLEIGDIVALTRTCKKLSDTYKRLLPLEWKINEKLSYFLKDPHEFRSQMAEHEALISGSFAIQFFARKFWPDSDLDVFVEQGDGEMAMCAAAVAQGYRPAVDTQAW